MRAKILLGLLLAILVVLFFGQGCGNGGGTTTPTGNNGGGTGGTGSGSGGGSGSPSQLSGVLMWKGNNTANGLYSETTLTPQNVSPSQFGQLARFHSDGIITAQPLFVANLDMGALGTHDLIIVVNERDQVLAFDATGASTQPLWQRSYLAPGITTAPDNYGGRTNLGGEIGITGTPVIDPSTGAMYFVTMFVRNGKVEQWLRAIDIRTGKDFGPGSTQIQATVPGDGKGSVNGQISFNPAIQNQRAALTLLNGNVLIAWGSFSDWGVYRGWLMAYDAKTLQQTAAFSPATQHQEQDSGNGPADHGGAASIWQAGAAPSIDSAGNIYVIAGDGSFNASSGGNNYGDSVLRLQLSNGAFQVTDYFTPSIHDCLNRADLEIGSGGLALLPPEAAGGRSLAVTISKEGSVYLLDPANLGKLTNNDAQIPQTFHAGNRTCKNDQGTVFAEGPDWQRLYGNPSYWNGNIYLAPSNSTLRQYRFSGGILSTTPAATSTNVFSLRGANTVVSANGTSNAIVWALTRTGAKMGQLFAYDATNVAKQLWNSRMNARDDIGPGYQFSVPVIANGKVIVAGKYDIVVYGLLQQSQ